MKLRTSHLMNFTLPYVGKFKSHGNKKVKRYKSDLEKDRKRKKNKYWQIKEGKLKTKA